MTQSFVILGAHGGVGEALCRRLAAGGARLGRIGAPEETASAIGWLLDAEQVWVTGQGIGVDGVLSRVRSRS